MNYSRVLALVVLLGVASPSLAHFHMLFPDKPSGERDKPVTFTLMWGHPFEQQLFDASPPEQVRVWPPSGEPIGPIEPFKKIERPAADGKKVVAYQFEFTPKERGDYTVEIQMPPIWMPEEKIFFADTVKVLYHVTTQKGWDVMTNKTGLDLSPLTRPYGLQPGMVFQAQASLSEKPLAGALVEVERYNPVAPKELPPDEQITRQVKTDRSGVATCSLMEAGWWCVTVVNKSVSREKDGEKFPIHHRVTYWVFVDGK